MATSEPLETPQPVTLITSRHHPIIQWQFSPSFLERQDWYGEMIWKYSCANSHCLMPCGWTTHAHEWADHFKGRTQTCEIIASKLQHTAQFAASGGYCFRSISSKREKPNVLFLYSQTENEHCIIWLAFSCLMLSTPILTLLLGQQIIHISGNSDVPLGVRISDQPSEDGPHDRCHHKWSSRHQLFC